MVERCIVAKGLLTLGVFFSVFLLTNTGLSYFTSEEFGGIMAVVVIAIYTQIWEKIIVNQSTRKEFQLQQ